MPKPTASRPKAAPASTAVSSAAAGGAATRADTRVAKATIEQRYLSALQQAIARHRFYPKAARQDGIEGTVTLSFVIEADGRITGVQIASASGSALLDQAGLETLARLGRFRPIPPELGRDRWPLRVPIRFGLR
ncbi:MAG: energy transducer TonB [Chromatiaceae bacterium]|nr:energy transducer TonB [Chromatiaceae bacterium]